MCKSVDEGLVLSTNSKRYSTSEFSAISEVQCLLHGSRGTMTYGRATNDIVVACVLGQSDTEEYRAKGSNRFANSWNHVGMFFSEI